MFACEDDFNFESEDSEFVSTYEIRPKGDLGFRIMKGKTRIGPLSLRLAKALQTWFDSTGDRRLVFTNRDGGPEGHFLYKVKEHRAQGSPQLPLLSIEDTSQLLVAVRAACCGCRNSGCLLRCFSTRRSERAAAEICVYLSERKAMVSG